MDLDFMGKIGTKGELQAYHKDDMNEKLAKYMAGKNVRIRITELSPKVNNRQRGYWYGIILKELGRGYTNIGYNYNASQIEEIAKTRFLMRERINEEDGKVENYEVSFKDNIDNKLFSKIVREAQMHASEDLQHYIPDPDPRKAKSC